MVYLQSAKQGEGAANAQKIGIDDIQAGFLKTVLQERILGCVMSLWTFLIGYWLLITLLVIR